MKSTVLKNKLKNLNFKIRHKLFLLERKWICHPVFGRFYPKKALYRRVAAVFMALVMIGATTLFYLRPQATEAAWFDDTYTYRQKITFVHNAALTNASMRLTVSNTNTLITAGKMQTDCDDSRFTNSNGELLRYKLVSGCNGASTVYDVVFPTVLNGTNLAFFYYGNSSAVSQSDSSVPTGTTPSGATSFATEEKGPAPVVYYSFDEGYGTIANNKGTCGATCSANLNNMSSPPASTSGWATDGKFGNALKFNGVNNSVIKINPAISRIGGIGDIHNTGNTGSQSINVPADATLAVVAVSGLGGTASFFSTTPPTINNVSMQTGRADDASILYGMSSIFYLVNPSTGSQALAWDWAGAGTCSSGCHIMYAFYKGINTADPIRSRGGNAALGAITITNIMNAQYGDLAVATGYSNDGTTGQDIAWTNATEVIDDIYNNSGGAYAEASPSASLNILTNFIENVGDKIALSSIVLKPAIPSTSGLNIGNINSVSFWIKTTQATTEIIDFNGTAYISLSSGSISANGFASPTFYIDGSATQVFPSDNSWHHVTVTSNTAINAHAMEIGKRGSNYFKGSLDEIKLYNYVLSASQAKTIRNSNSASVFGNYTKNTLSEGLLAYWPLDNRFYQGVSVVDVSGRGETLIATKGGDFVPFTESFTTAGAGTWTSPSDVNSVVVEAWGGGGAGARRTAAGDGGGGGGGGAYAKSTVAVSPSTQYDYYVGNGGVSSSATNGENSTFESTVVVAAGGKTPAVNSTTGVLGGAIADSTGDEKRNGGDGANGSATNGGGGGSSAASGSDGTDATSSTGATAPAGGGNGGNGGSSFGLSGTQPGGGGGGGRYLIAARDGGQGGIGKVNITYNVAQTITGNAGKIGQGFNFDGTNDKITSTNTINNIQSIAFWASPSATTQTLIDFNGSGTNIKINSGSMQANGFVNPVIYVDGVQTNTFPDTAWHHVVITSANPINASSFTMGFADSTYYDGLLDDVRLYNRALGQQEIVRLFEWGPDPKAHWKFDERSGTTVTDSSGNQYNGNVLNGAEWVTGKFGAALYLGQKLDVTNPTYVSVPVPEHEDITVSLWFKTDGAQTGVDGAALITIYDFVGNGTTLSIDTGGNIEYKSDVLGMYYYTSGTRYDDNKWHYVTGMTRGTSTFVYVDGVPRTLSSGSASGASVNYLTANIGLGSEGRFKGSIDDVRIYDYARSAKQIVSDMNAGHPAVGSPIASAIGHWKFDEGYGTTANNSGSGGTVLNGALTDMDSPATYGSGWTNSGKFGKALNFDGSNDNISVPSNTSLAITGDLTLSIWAKRKTANIVHNLIDYAAPGELETANHLYEFYLDASNNLVLEWEYAAGSNEVVTSSKTVSNPSDTWAHYMVSRNSNTKQVDFYENGVKLGATQAYTNNPTGGSLSSFVIGRDNASTIQVFDGTLDEVKIYNYTLSSDEVKSEFNQGKSVVMGALATDVNGQSTNSAARAYCPPGNTDSNCAAGLNPAPVGHWALDERRGLTANDISGNANNGTLTNGPIWTNGKVGQGLSLDGADDLINAGSNSNIDDVFQSGATIEAWVNPGSCGEGNEGVLFEKNDWDFTICAAGSKRLRFFANFDGATNGEWNSAANSIDFNKWQHIAIVYNSSSASNEPLFYINGVLSTTTENINPAGSHVSDSTDTLYIGAFGGAAQAYDGSIDDVRIYNYARSPAQIAWDYNRGGPVGHWKFDECQGAVVYDSSGFGNNGTITAGAAPNTSVGTCSSGTTTEMWDDGTNGKYSSSLGFDGTNDVVTVSNSSVLPSSTMSISAWVKRSTTGNWDRLVEHEWDTVQEGSWGLFIDSGNDAQFVMKSSGGTQRLAQFTTDLTSDTWYHLVGTYDGSTGRVYINGVEGEQTFSTSNIAIDTSGNIVIGGLTDLLEGNLDDVRIYNYALSPIQIKLLYNENSAVRFAPLTGSP